MRAPDSSSHAFRTAGLFAMCFVMFGTAPMVFRNVVVQLGDLTGGGGVLDAGELGHGGLLFVWGSFRFH
ncbi:MULTISPECIES: hypothetical protein [unclassified Streptomyces]|uniref:hypothetical protein n=1 Tax=unclassified Streptomyces TaxID=2593676 RepID=UPI003D947E34